MQNGAEFDRLFAGSSTEVLAADRQQGTWRSQLCRTRSKKQGRQQRDRSSSAAAPGVEQTQATDRHAAPRAHALMLLLTPLMTPCCYNHTAAQRL
jgi:hypothetical protein